MLSVILIVVLTIGMLVSVRILGDVAAKKLWGLTKIYAIVLAIAVIYWILMHLVIKYLS